MNKLHYMFREIETPENSLYHYIEREISSKVSLKLFVRGYTLGYVPFSYKRVFYI